METNLIIFSTLYLTASMMFHLYVFSLLFLQLLPPQAFTPHNYFPSLVSFTCFVHLLFSFTHFIYNFQDVYFEFLIRFSAPLLKLRHTEDSASMLFQFVCKRHIVFSFSPLHEEYRQKYICYHSLSHNCCRIYSC